MLSAECVHPMFSFWITRCLFLFNYDPSEQHLVWECMSAHVISLIWQGSNPPSSVKQSTWSTAVAFGGWGALSRSPLGCAFDNSIIGHIALMSLVSGMSFPVLKVFLTLVAALLSKTWLTLSRGAVVEPYYFDFWGVSYSVLILKPNAEQWHTLV